MINTDTWEKLKDAYGFLGSLSTGEEEAFRQYSMLKVLPAGETVFLEGDTCTFFAFVLSGRVRVFKAGETGREITLYRFQKGEGCILTASCILSSNKFPAQAVVEEETETVLVPNELLREYVKGYESWRSYFFSLLAGRLGEVMEIVDEVVFRKMDSRIAELLLERLQENRLDVSLDITHREIASELGTSREVVSRILKDLEKENIIQIDRGKINIINPLQLKSKII